MHPDLELRKREMQKYMGRTVRVVVDRPIGYLHGDVLYPVNYGFVPGTLAGDGEEQDAYILGVDAPLTEFEGQVVAVILRRDDEEDKLVVAPAGRRFHQGEIAEAVRFQEQYFDTVILSSLELSCGVLARRRVSAKTEFLLVYESHSKCWSLPKGHMETGETDTQTALRELFEETGLTAVLEENRRASIEYPISEFARKRVIFFLGRVQGEPMARQGEIDACRWVTEEELEHYLFPDVCAACRKLLRECDESV